MAEDNGSGSPQIQARFIDPSDRAELTRWAEKMSRGEDLEKFAARLGVAPSLDAVVAAVTKGLSADAREVVSDAFRKELSG